MWWVGMEACGGAHYWGRQLGALGHEVRLLAPQHVKGYVQGNKTDYNDARAIVAALGRPGMRFVAVKAVWQQDRQALYRLRQGCIGEQTALYNRLRGLPAEYGLVVPLGVVALRRAIPELLADADNRLSDGFRALLAREYERWGELSVHIAAYTARQSTSKGTAAQAWVGGGFRRHAVNTSLYARLRHPCLQTVGESLPRPMLSVVLSATDQASLQHAARMF